VLYHAGDPFQPEGKNLGLRDRAEGAIDDEIALIGDERSIPLTRPELDLAVAARLHRNGLDQAHGRK
jgi:hypothetical protein